MLTAAQDTARRHVTASREARAEVDALLGSVGAEVEVALAQLHRSLADIRARLLSDEVTSPSEGRDGTGADSLRSYEYGLLLNTQQTVEGMTTAAQREAQRIVDLANAEVAALEQRIERLRSVEAEMQAGIAEGSLRTAPLADRRRGTMTKGGRPGTRPSWSSAQVDCHAAAPVARAHRARPGPLAAPARQARAGRHPGAVARSPGAGERHRRWTRSVPA